MYKLLLNLILLTILVFSFLFAIKPEFVLADTNETVYYKENNHYPVPFGDLTSMKMFKHILILI